MPSPRAEQYGESLEEEELDDILNVTRELELCSVGEGCSRADFVLAMLVRMDKVRGKPARGTFLCCVELFLEVAPMPHLTYSLDAYVV